MTGRTILKALESAIHGDILTRTEFIKFYSVDASSYKITPKIVVVPTGERDVLYAVKIAKEFNISITARGAGTGLVGSALNTGIILDMKNFDSFQLDGHSVMVGSGMSKGRLDKELAAHKKRFPPNPSVGLFCSVGGMLGTNASGSRSIKYGSVIDNVLEIAFVDGNGDKITLPKDRKKGRQILKFTNMIDLKKFPNVTKNSSGYRIDAIKTVDDSHKIMIGSEGTLGIILYARLGITDTPNSRILCIVGYDSAAAAARDCIQISRTHPSAIEFVDRTIMNHIRHRFDAKVTCLLFVEYDEDTAASKEQLRLAVTGKIIKEISRESEIAVWWRYRDLSLHYSLKAAGDRKNRVPHIIEDAAVPLEKLSSLFSLLDKINEEFGAKSIIYGHAGDGNMHVRLILKRNDKRTLKKIATQYFEEIIRLGGTITAEHGDGLARTEFVKDQYGSKNYQTFKEIKKLFDPQNILNPGKIIK